MNTKEVYQAIRAKAHAMAGDKVSANETDMRLAICTDCPFLKEPEFLKEKLAAKLSGSDYVCGICHCGIDLLSVTKAEFLHDDTPEQSSRRPYQCWHPRLK